MACILVVLVVSVAGNELAEPAPAKKAKMDVQCFECKAYGHFKKQCPLLAAKAAKGGS